MKRLNPNTRYGAFDGCTPNPTTVEQAEKNRQNKPIRYKALMLACIEEIKRDIKKGGLK